MLERLDFGDTARKAVKNKLKIETMVIAARTGNKSWELFSGKFCSMNSLRSLAVVLFFSLGADAQVRPVQKFIFSFRQAGGGIQAEAAQQDFELYAPNARDSTSVTPHERLLRELWTKMVNFPHPAVGHHHIPNGRWNFNKERLDFGHTAQSFYARSPTTPIHTWLQHASFPFTWG